MDEAPAPASNDPGGLFEPGVTCWRIARAGRASFLIDTQSYYEALFEALRAARKSILILGWAFDPRTRLAPDGSEGPEDPDEIGRILIALSRLKPDLDVRILVWKSRLGVNGRQDVRGHRATRLFARTAVRFREARDVPFGASHHQKVVVIDDQVAFCGGGDIVTNRWDTHDHLHADPRRILPEKRLHPPRHEVMMLVDGAAAGSLADLFRERWRDATGEAPGDPAPVPGDAWPACATVHMSGVEVAIARTKPGWMGRSEATEIRQLTLACIASARRTIYLENQYFTSSGVCDALARRLAEPDGPEILLIVSGRAPSWFDQLTMGHARNPLVRRLQGADRFGRFRAFSPRNAAGDGIIVHSKLGIFDDRVVRIGSANLNNRSEGYDTECDLAIEARTVAAHNAVSDFRNRLLSHYLAVDPARFRQATVAANGLVAAVDALNRAGRLTPVATGGATWWEGFVSDYRLGDPRNVAESWRLLGRNRSTDIR